MGQDGNFSRKGCTEDKAEEKLRHAMGRRITRLRILSSRRVPLLREIELQAGLVEPIAHTQRVGVLRQRPGLEVGLVRVRVVRHLPRGLNGRKRVQKHLMGVLVAELMHPAGAGHRRPRRPDCA